jgi:hypothetical protein
VPSETERRARNKGVILPVDLYGCETGVLAQAVKNTGSYMRLNGTVGEPHTLRSSPDIIRKKNNKIKKKKETDLET